MRKKGFFTDVDDCLVRGYIPKPSGRFEGGNTSFGFARAYLINDRKFSSQDWPYMKMMQDYENYGEGVDNASPTVGGQENAITLNTAFYCRHLEGRTVSEMEGAARRDMSSVPLFAGVEDALVKLARDGYDIWLLSAGADFLVKALRERLKSSLTKRELPDATVEFEATEIPDTDGTYSGRPPEEEKIMQDSMKRKRVSEIRKDRGYTHTLSVGDSEGDIGMLSECHSCFVFNPRKHPWKGSDPSWPVGYQIGQHPVFLDLVTLLMKS